MHILLDQATPVPLRPFLVGHTVRTAAEEGWDKLSNGDLLRAAEEKGFNLLLTTDKNMPHQQNLAGRSIGVVVLSVQAWHQLRPHTQLVVDAVSAARPGEFARIEIPAD
jgi:hypothetical protein